MWGDLLYKSRENGCRVTKHTVKDFSRTFINFGKQTNMHNLVAQGSNVVAMLTLLNV